MPRANELPEVTTVRLPGGKLAAVDAVLATNEARPDLIRAAIDAEIERRTKNEDRR